jgi:hypothetical protein
MKRPDFGDVLKIGKWVFSGVEGLMRTRGIQISFQILGYLTGHSWVAPTVLT